MPGSSSTDPIAPATIGSKEEIKEIQEYPTSNQQVVSLLLDISHFISSSSDGGNNVILQYIISDIILANLLSTLSDIILANLLSTRQMYSSNIIIR